MKMFQIREEAASEVFDLVPYLRQIADAMDKHPDGTDISLPWYLIPKIEAHCDNSNIPFYRLCGETCSTAKTYSQLLEYENQR